MVSRVDDTVLNWMNRDRMKGGELDPIAIERRCCLLVGCLGVACLSLTEWSEWWLICRNLCMPSYIQNRQITNREIPTVTAVTAQLC